MATIANWNGHTFEISPSLIRGFTNLAIKGSCETTTKNSEEQKYEERKYGEALDISMDVSLNAQTGVTDVFSEAMAWVNEATNGGCAYFYLGTTKLIPAKLLLKSAEISEIVFMPGKGDVWISCTVKLNFRQGTKMDGGSQPSSGGYSGGGGSSSGKKKKKASVKTTGAIRTMQPPAGSFVGMTNPMGMGLNPVGLMVLPSALNQVKSTVNNAKAGSAGKVPTGGLDKANGLANKGTTTTSNSNTKKNATTGRSTSGGTSKRTTVSLR